jgi:hypothetical protein
MPRTVSKYNHQQQRAWSAGTLKLLGRRALIVLLAWLGGLVLCHWRSRVSSHCTYLLSYDPSYGAWNNQLMALFVGIHLAQLLGRRLVVPALVERARPTTSNTWFDVLDIDAALLRRWILPESTAARCRRRGSMSTVFDARNISLRLHRDAACGDALGSLRDASARAGPLLLQLAHLYGLMRCFTRSEASFLRLWQRITLRETPVAKLWMQRWGALEGAPASPPLVVVVHLRRSGFEPRAHARRPDDFPANALLAWVLAGNESACVSSSARCALCQLCAIQRRDPDARPLHFYVMHDGHGASLQTLALWKTFVEAQGDCGAAPSRVYDLTALVQESWQVLSPTLPAPGRNHIVSVVSEMYLAVYGAHLFVGSPLSTLSSNVARWRALGRYPLAPSLSYTGDRYLSAIPHMFGFH